MKFFSVPDPRTGAVTRQMLTDLQQANILPHNIGAFASQQHWIEAVGTGAPSDGSGAKYWRDNSTIWRASADRFQYLMLDRNSDGSFVRMAMNFSDPCFTVLSLETANFYRQYAKHFPVIPRMIIKTMSRYDAGRLNFGSGIAEDFPLGILEEDPTGPANGFRASFPSSMALRFNPQTGQPEAFYWEEYVREYPFDWTPAGLGSSSAQRLSDDELVASVTGLVASSMAVKDKASIIRQLAKS